MPFCHTCRVEYPLDLDACSECGGRLVDAPTPERRIYAGADAGMVVVAVLPPEQAFVASDRLDRGGIPSALREIGGDGVTIDPSKVNVLVPPAHLADARRVLRGKKVRTVPVMTFVLVATAAAVFLSGLAVVARWVLTGSPVPG